MSTCDLILVGPRPGALRAAGQLELATLLVDERPPSPRAARRALGVVEGSFEDLPALVESVAARLGAARPRAVVACGERGVLAASVLRAALGVPGAGPDLARRLRDKAAMKRTVREAGVHCTDWLALAPETRIADVVLEVGLPAVLKHRSGAGSRGLTVLHTWSDLQQALDSLPPEARRDWMVERFVNGEEMSVESFVVDGRVLLANPTEYFVPACANIAPAALEPEAFEEILDLNARALAALGVERGMTHLELYRTAHGPVFGEVALRPPGGRIMRLIRRAWAFDPWEALLRIELGETPGLPAQARAVAGVWMIHPGAGRVTAVEGLEAARRVRGVRKLVCRLEPGDEVAARESTGSDMGWIEVGGRSRDAVAERLCTARQHVRIHLEAQERGGFRARV